MPPSGTTVIRDRPNHRWSRAEETALHLGIAKHGAGKWQQIITDPDPSIGLQLKRRSNVDLKDKWRNMRPKVVRSMQKAMAGKLDEQPGLHKRRRPPPSLHLMPNDKQQAAVKRAFQGRGSVYGGTSGAYYLGNMWAAALDPSLQNDPALVAHCLVVSQQQASSAPAAFQAMADYAAAFAAARDKQQAALLAAMQQEQKQAEACKHSSSYFAGGAPSKPSKSNLAVRLQSACEELDVSAAADVLQAGAAAAAAGSDGRTVLHALAAASHGASDAITAGQLVGLLVQHGAQLDAQDAAGATALHLAANAPMAAILLAAGASVHTTNNAGETPLFAAAAAKAATVIRVLLQQGACVDHQDDCGETALIRAAGREDGQAAAMRLLEGGASVSIVDGAGRTALHAAAEAGNGALVAALLTRGAAAGATDAEGDSPSALASRGGYHQIAADLLRSRNRPGAFH